MSAPAKKQRPLQRIYDWMIVNSRTRYAWWILGAVSFAESSFFPIPPDVMLFPMMIADRKRSFLLAAWCALFSVLGGMLGYAIGALFYDTIGTWLISVYGGGKAIETFRDAYAEWGGWIILAKGALPIIPFKIVTILSGFAGYNFYAFVFWSVIVRFFLRFGLLAVLVYFYGAPIQNFIEKRLELMLLLVVAGIVLGFVIIRYVI